MPNKTKRGPYSGGYNDITAAKLKNVTLPDKILCEGCKHWKSPPEFSKKQLSDARYKILNGAPGCAKCRKCTGQQVNELQCIICDKVKGLEEFALAQRRTPDMARCLMCIDEIAAVEPGYEDIHSDHASEVSNPYDYGSEDETNNSDGGVKLHPELNRTSLAQLDSMTGGSESYKPSAGKAAIMKSSEQEPCQTTRTNAWTNWASTADARSEVSEGNVWITRPNDKGKAAMPFTAYDAQGGVHSRHCAPSVSEQSSSAWVKPSRDKFPKPSKAPVAKLAQRSEQPRENDRAFTALDEGETDSDDDYLR